jgi:hypothetical protein
MNGRRRKALKREFRALNGRDPMPTVAALIENTGTFVNKQGLRQFEAAFDHYGELHFFKTMGVGRPSEERAIKRAYIRSA